MSLQLKFTAGLPHRLREWRRQRRGRLTSAKAGNNPSGALLAAIASSGTLAMHMLVPALPAVARQFAASPGAAQLTLTVYLIGIAGGQLVYGPLSDRFGRRPVVIAALSVFLAATGVAAFAPHLPLLIAARFLQAVGACGGLVLGRAIVRDGAAPEQAARRLALLVHGDDDRASPRAADRQPDRDVAGVARHLWGARHR